MLIILISAAWFTIMAFTVIVCRCAARADALATAMAIAPSETPAQPRAAALGGEMLIVFELAPRSPRLRARRPRGARASVSSVRARSGRCAAGS